MLFQMNAQWIIAPLVGMIIGWLTNSLAIKMLFRPQKAHYIGRLHIPLTPGVVPKEQPRIAKALGDAVARELLSAEILQSTLVSDTMQEKVAHLADNIYDRYAHSPATLREELRALFGEEAVNDFVNGAYDKLTDTIYNKLNESSIEDEILAAVSSRSEETNAPKGLGRILGSGNIGENITKPLIRKICKRLTANSLGIIKDTLHKEGDHLLERPVAELIGQYKDKLPYFRELLVNNYTKTVNEDLPKILEAINIAKIVEDRINAYDISEMEVLINTLAKKELNAIVAIGAVLGFILGFVNVLLGKLF